MKNESYKKFLPYITSIIFLIIIFSFLNTAKTITDYFSLNLLLYILLTLLAYSLVKIINTLRYSYVYNINSRYFLKTFSIMCLSNLLLNIIPFRAGEYSYLSYFNKYFNIDKKTGLAKLSYLRFFDYLSIYFIFVVSSLFININERNYLVKNISLVFIIALILIFFFLYIFRNTVRKTNARNKYVLVAKNIITEFEVIYKKSSVWQIIFVGFLSLCYWFYRIAVGYLVLYLIGLKLTFFQVVFGSCFLTLGSLLPIQTISGLGIYEATWSYYLSLFGFQLDYSLAVSVMMHIIVMIPVFIYGLFGYLFLKKNHEM